MGACTWEEEPEGASVGEEASTWEETGARKGTKDIILFVPKGQLTD